MNSRDSLRLPLLLTVGLRIFYSLAAALVVPALHLDPRRFAINFQDSGLMHHSAGLPYRLWGVWQRFDTIYYLHIARQGYDLPQSVVFYPLYPMLTAVLTPLTGQPLAAALLVSTIAAFFFLWGFVRLLQLDLAPVEVRFAVLLSMAWPSAFILFAGYPESLLMALMVWSVWNARRGQWTLAGILGLLAGLTKAAGALVLIPLVVLAIRKKTLRAWPVMLAALGPLLFAGYLALTGHISAAAAYPRYWRTTPAWPWDTLMEGVRGTFEPNILIAMELLLLIAMIVVTIARPIRLEYPLFVVSAALLFLTKKTSAILQSTLRYIVVVFPLYASIALLVHRPLALAAILVLAFLLNLVTFYAFLDWYLIV